LGSEKLQQEAQSVFEIGQRAQEQREQDRFALERSSFFRSQQIGAGFFRATTADRTELGRTRAEQGRTLAEFDEATRRQIFEMPAEKEKIAAARTELRTAVVGEFAVREAEAARNRAGRVDVSRTSGLLAGAEYETEKIVLAADLEKRQLIRQRAQMGEDEFLSAFQASEFRKQMGLKFAGGGIGVQTAGEVGLGAPMRGEEEIGAQMDAAVNQGALFAEVQRLTAVMEAKEAGAARFG
jgi:hypothetical protein